MLFESGTPGLGYGLPGVFASSLVAATELNGVFSCLLCPLPAQP